MYFFFLSFVSLIRKKDWVIIYNKPQYESGKDIYLSL